MTLDVIGHEAAGHVFEGAIAPGETVRIMTGAPVPEGADAVVKYEIVEVLDGDGNEGSHASFSRGQGGGERSLCCRGGPCRDVVMRAGEVVAPAARPAGKRRLREREGARCPTCGHHLAGHGAGRAE